MLRREFGMSISIKQRLCGLAVCAAVGCTPAQQGSATHRTSGQQPAQERTMSNTERASAAQAAVQAYFDALNKGDVDAAVAAYTPGGYFALQGAEDLQGATALRTLYETAFK